MKKWYNVGGYKKVSAEGKKHEGYESANVHATGFDEAVAKFIAKYPEHEPSSVSLEGDVIE
jgi:hypothetical protein